MFQKLYHRRISSVFLPGWILWWNGQNESDDDCDWILCNRFNPAGVCITRLFKLRVWKTQQLSRRDIQMPERIFRWSKTFCLDWWYSVLMRLSFFDVFDWVAVAPNMSLGCPGTSNDSYVRILLYVLEGRWVDV